MLFAVDHDSININLPFDTFVGLVEKHSVDSNQSLQRKII